MATPLNVLILEDSQDDAVLLAHELKNVGFDPAWHRVETEEEYLARLGPQVDIIFSDFGLPQFSSPKALSLLQESRLRIPFIIVSGTIGEERAVEILKAGATDYVMKDRLGRLGPVVRRALREVREQEERHRAEKALQESELKFRQLAENITEVFWMTDPAKNQMLYISPAYEKIWGRSCESLYSDAKAWLEAIHPDDRQRVGRVAVERQAAGTYDEQYRILRPDGEIRWIRDRAFPVRNEAGQAYRIVGVAEDTTHSRKLEEQFRQAQKMEGIGQLAGGVAHDFNNILTVIQGHSSLLKLEQDLLPHVIESASEIQRSAERAANLTRQLLMFSRRQTMQPRDLDLNEVIANITKMLHRILGEDVHLQITYSPQTLHVHADAGMLDQVVMNLAVNSRDAMPKGGHLVIETSLVNVNESMASERPLARSGSFACLSVSDNGCGIPPENLPRIFEPFFTTKDIGKGTGIGLATVFGIVQQHQGWIEVASDVGIGTTFHIYIPLLQRPAEKAAHSSPHHASPGGHETILLVEDEPSLRHLVRNVLSRMGYRILEAPTGVTALDIWKQQKDDIQLLLTDMVMPDGISGTDLAQQLRKDNPDLKVIITSGYSAEMAGQDFELQEGVNFLSKPFNPRQLAEIVRKSLGQNTVP